MNLSEMVAALKEVEWLLTWERESLEDFHQYAQKFGGTPGCNVFTFALADALRHRGMTLEQFRELRGAKP